MWYTNKNDIKQNDEMDDAVKNCTPKGKEERGQHNTKQMGHTYIGLMTSVEGKENSREKLYKLS